MNRLALMTALAMTLLLGLPAGAFAQVDEPPPPPPLGDEDEPAPPPARARRAPPPRSADRAAKTQDATDEDSPVVRPSGEEGNMGLFFRFGGLATMTAKGDSIATNSSAINTQIGFKFVLSESMMIPIFFGTAIDVAKTEGEDGKNNFSMDFGAGMEYHFRIWRRLSPFFGALLKFGFYDPTQEDNLIFRFHVGPLIGVEYFIADRVSLAAAYMLMFSVVHTQIGSDSSSTDFDMTTKAGQDVAASTGGDLTLTFYF